MEFLHFSILGKYGQSTGSNILIHHLLDTAAVSLALWEGLDSKLIKKQIKEYTCSLFNRNGKNMNNDNVKNCLGFLSSLHDLGKISPNFQKNIWKSGVLNQKMAIFNFYEHVFQKPGERIGTREKIHHSALSYQTIQEIKTVSYDNSLLDFKNLKFDEIGLIVSAHHGIFHKSEVFNKMERNQEGYLGIGEWCEFRKTHVNALSQIFFHNHKNYMLNEKNSILCENKVQNAIWLAGFLCISDWIASNEKYFPYSIRTPEQWNDLNNYWNIAQERAKVVIKNLNWGVKKKRIGKELATFMHIFNREPRELQQKIDEININDSECIIIEAPTGEGKTEAAMYMMVKNDLVGLSGAYFALPTQATSNQMFTRVKEFLSKYYINPDEEFNLMLLHGHATLVDKFEKIVEFSPKNIHDDDGTIEATPRVSQWFTYKKRGLLTSYGVGTIDQALMSILQTKHYFVRLNGLAGKTIILDEIHAYDTYMSELIEKMLTWLAALGSSVILLSATLPSSKRAQFLAAYQKGKAFKYNTLDGNITHFINQSRYPRITWTNGKKVKELEFKPSNVGKKIVNISWIVRDSIGQINHNPYKNSGIKGRIYSGSLKDLIKENLRNGGCGAIICNRVDEAQGIYENLKDLENSEEDYIILLFHSRFRVLERNEIEMKITNFFGENRNSRPKRAVLIATQVIEQSLDIDFDFMVSAIAPVDLILQRMGRLYRHNVKNRIGSLKSPELVIMVPTPNTEYSSFLVPEFKIYSRIYHPHILLRSWLYLKDVSLLKIPEMTEEAVEFVYDINDIPEQFQFNIELVKYWNHTWEKLQKKKNKIKKMAINQLIRDPDGEVPFYKISESQLEEDDPLVHRFQRAQTRLIGPSMGAILLRKDEEFYYTQKIHECKNSLQDYFPKGFKKWLLERMINITNYTVIKSLQDTRIPSEWDKDSHLKFIRLIILDDSDEINLSKDLKLKLNNDLGLIIKKNGV